MYIPGRFLTGSTGEYVFRTIKPGLYTGRTRHIHFKVKKGAKELLTTQCYVKGEGRNERDFIYRSVRDPKARELMVSSFDWETTSPDWCLGYRFDVVLGGRLATPLEVR